MAMDNFIDEWERALTNKKPKAFVYSILFDDGSAYVGITKNLKKRQKRHEWNSSNPGVKERMGKVNFSFNVVHKIYESEQRMLENTALIDYGLKGYTILNVGTITSKNYSLKDGL